MPANTAMLHVRIDADLRNRAVAALDAIGLSTSDAVRLLFHRIAADQAFPLELKVPNATTRAAMEESNQMMREARQRFNSAEEMFEALDRGE